MYLLLLLAQNLPTELQVCPQPQTHRVGVFWGLNPGGLAVSQVKILLDEQVSAHPHLELASSSSLSSSHPELA